MARLLIATLIFMPFISRVDFKKALTLFVIGVVQFGLMSLTYMVSFRYLKSHEVALFTIMTPLYIVGLHCLWHRKINKLNIITALVAVIGAGIILWRGFASQAPLMGFILVEISNLCFASGQLAYREYFKTESNVPGVSDHATFAWLYLGGASVLLPFAIYEVATIPFVITLEHYMVIAYLGVIASGLGFFLWNSGARRVAPGVLAVMNNLKVPLAVGVSLVFFAEPINQVSLLAGGVLVFAALISVLHLNNQNHGLLRHRFFTKIPRDK